MLLHNQNYIILLIHHHYYYCCFLSSSRPILPPTLALCAATGITCPLRNTRTLTRHYLVFYYLPSAYARLHIRHSRPRLRCDDQNFPSCQSDAPKPFPKLVAWPFGRSSRSSVGSWYSWSLQARCHICQTTVRSHGRSPDRPLCGSQSRRVDLFLRASRPSKSPAYKLIPILNPGSCGVWRLKTQATGALLLHVLDITSDQSTSSPAVYPFRYLGDLQICQQS